LDSVKKPYYTELDLKRQDTAVFAQKTAVFTEYQDPEKEN
jgi:hypothetical protein